MAQNDIGIDLGTTSVIINVEGRGIVLNEPTIVAVDTRTDKVLAVGEAAYKMVGRTPSHIIATFPLEDGVIADYQMTKEIVRRFVLKVYNSRIIKPRVAVCVPTSITGVENDAVVEAALSAGARQVYLIEEPIAAALGCGIDILKPQGHMVVDIGGGTTDAAVISLGGKVLSNSVKVAGNIFDKALIHYLRVKYSILVGQKSAESLKKEVGCCSKALGYQKQGEIKGRSLVTHLPQKLTLKTSDLYEPLIECAQEIVNAAKQVLERTPPELAGDIFEEGIFLTGGSAQMMGLAEFMSEKLKVNVKVADDPVNCVSRGTAKSLEMTNQLESGFRDATPGLGKR